MVIFARKLKCKTFLVIFKHCDLSGYIWQSASKVHSDPIKAKALHFMLLLRDFISHASAYIINVMYYKYIALYFTAAPECDAGQFSCVSYKFNHTNCIPSHFRCDKEQDCHDGSDEESCSKYLTFLSIVREGKGL